MLILQATRGCIGYLSTWKATENAMRPKLPWCVAEWAVPRRIAIPPRCTSRASFSNAQLDLSTNTRFTHCKSMSDRDTRALILNPLDDKPGLLAFP